MTRWSYAAFSPSRTVFGTVEADTREGAKLNSRNLAVHLIGPDVEVFVTEVPLLDAEDVRRHARAVLGLEVKP